MSVKLKEETILNQWSTLIDGGAARGDEVLEGIQFELLAARIPGDCKWSMTVVHHCVLDGVKSLCTKLGQDPSGIRRETKGFLQVW